jgi:hypothetical protein
MTNVRATTRKIVIASIISFDPTSVTSSRYNYFSNMPNDSLAHGLRLNRVHPQSRK